jgi:hypothetical protein
VEDYYHGYVDPISKELGTLFGEGLQYFLMDSYEAGHQNWTDDMISEFRNRRGYDLTPYLPVLTGHLVGSAEVSDRFLWDFRRTIADLLAENHYGVFAELAHKQGLGIYSEAAGVSVPVMEDGLQNKGLVDIPMGEFWLGVDMFANCYYSDNREAASAAHIYGKKIAGAESWSGGNYEAPFRLKRYGDYWNTQGINRFIFHTSAHQPLDTKPGNTMVGTHINRNITWAELSGPFMTYLSRNMYLLQQGLFVGDLCYYVGEGAPATVPYWEDIQPEPPEGYKFDFLNSDVLLTRMSVKDGRLVLPDGMSYSVLVLPAEADHMTLPVLQKISDMVAAGATVVGPKPVESPSLAGYPSVDEKVKALANEVWGDTDGRSVTKNTYGKGMVVWGLPLSDMLTTKGVLPDIEYTRPNINTHLEFLHRQLNNIDIYFISNRNDQVEDLKVRFRVNGKTAELWHSDNGVIEPAEYSIVNGRTTVPLHLEPYESVFVVFRNPAASQSRQLQHPVSTVLGEITGSWDISFPPHYGAPEKIRVDDLVSWTENPEDGVKYFSGTATYTKNIQVPKDLFRPEAKIFIDLGTVKDIAEVKINGEPLGILWKEPYKVDVSDVLEQGANRLEIKVTNQWNNRIAGDRSLPEDKKILSATGVRLRLGGTQELPLDESGLLGPVTVFSVSEE